MLNQGDLEQHDQIYARSPVILTIQRFHKVIQKVKVYRHINFPKQMVLFLFYHFTTKKPSFRWTFFDRLRPRGIPRGIFLTLPNGIPDSDTFRRVFEKVNPQELSEVLRDWLDIYRKKRSVVSVNGKTIRGSEGSEHKAYHVVSAFVRENCITLGEIKTDGKSNEITAVPELLEMLDLKEAIVTALSIPPLEYIFTGQK